MSVAELLQAGKAGPTQARRIHKGHRRAHCQDGTDLPVVLADNEQTIPEDLAMMLGDVAYYSNLPGNQRPHCAAHTLCRCLQGVGTYAGSASAKRHYGGEAAQSTAP